MTPAVTTQDNSYEYDGLQQVTRHDRGDLMPASGPPFTGIDSTTRQQKEDFAFDETGNWTQYQSATPATTWTQDRVNNAANQIDSLAGPTGVVQPTFSHEHPATDSSILEKRRRSEQDLSGRLENLVA